MKTRPLDPDKIRRILVSAGPGIGDILLATPLLRSLRDACPNAAIDVLVFDGQEGILEGNPDVNRIVTVAKRPGLRGLLKLLRNIFRRYDLALSTKWTDRVIWYIVLASRFRVSVVPADRDAWKRWITQASVNYDHDDTHTVVLNNRLAGCLGLPTSHTLVPPASPNARQALERIIPERARGRPYAVLHLNPGLPYKRWTLEGWAAVAHHLDERGVQIFLTGHRSEDETRYLESALARMPAQAVNLSGELTFAELAVLLGDCSVCVGVDTVVTHLAAAVGAPTVALFGPVTPRVWGPWPKGYDRDVSPFVAEGTQRAGNVLVAQWAGQCPTCAKACCGRRRERDRECVLMSNLGAGQVIDGIDTMLP